MTAEPGRESLHGWSLAMAIASLGAVMAVWIAAPDLLSPRAATAVYSAWALGAFGYLFARIEGHRRRANCHASPACACCCCVVLFASYALEPRPEWWKVAVAVAIIVLDAVDGAVARRDSTTERGAVFDMESDAFYLVTMCGIAHVYLGVHPLVFVVGALRPIYVCVWAVLRLFIAPRSPNRKGSAARPHHPPGAGHRAHRRAQPAVHARRQNRHRGRRRGPHRLLVRRRYLGDARGGAGGALSRARVASTRGTYYDSSLHPSVQREALSMFKLTIRDYLKCAHSLKGEIFGPAQLMHVITYEVEAVFMGVDFDEYGLIVNFASTQSALQDILSEMNFKTWTTSPQLRGKNTDHRVPLPVHPPEHQQRGGGSVQGRACA